MVCHGIPGPKTLRDGDILNIDVTVILDGWYGDTSRMYFVGAPSVKASRLTEVTYDCLMRGIDAARPGNTLGDIGHAIQEHAESNRFSVVRDFTGHGLDRHSIARLQSCITATPGQACGLNRDDFHHRTDDQCRPA